MSRAAAAGDEPVRDLDALLGAMAPALNEGVFVFAVVADAAALDGLDVIATFRESEGVTAVLAESEALAAGLDVVYRAGWITLGVHSDLDGVGLTAAVARALADAGISCNVLAAVHHDHLFVPIERVAEAIGRLDALQARAAGVGARPAIALKRAYEPAEAGDGCRVLVERLWPRGISKTDAQIDLWPKSLAPSAELRRWFAHEPTRWAQFRDRYLAELRALDDPLGPIRAALAAGPVTFVFAARETEYNNAVALAEFVRDGALDDASSEQGRR